MLSDLTFRFRSLIRRRRAEAELEAELRFHYENQVEKGIRSGLNRKEARRQARLLVGGIEQVKEECRDARGVRTVEVFLQDLQFGWRTLWRTPGFTIVALLTLGLGVGANTAMFSIVDAVLLRPLPFREPDRLVRILFSTPSTGSHGILYSVPELEDLRNRAGIFDSVTGTERGSIDLTGGARTQRLEMVTASPNYFSMLGVKPQIGRLFSPQDFTSGLAPSAVISDSLWRREFGGDRSILGRTIRLDGDVYEIVGVLPPGFRHPRRPSAHDVQVWLASGFMSAADPPPLRGNRAFPAVLARLKRGITIEQARSRLAVMAAGIRRDFPADYPPPSDWTVEITPLEEDVVGKVRPMLLALFGAASLILLIVTLNIANLLLARASGRLHEMATRVALGAGRRRVIGQMLTESTLLSCLGGIAGLATACSTLDVILRVMPSNVPRLSEVKIDSAVLGFSFLVSLLAGLVFGIAPALQVSRSALTSGLRQGGRGSSATVKIGRMRDVLIVSEVAMAVVLVIGAGLLLRSLAGLLNENPGFDPAHIVTASVNLPFPSDPKNDPYRTLAKQTVFYRELGRRIRSIPGVTISAFSSYLPGGAMPLHFTLRIEDRPNLSDLNLRAQHILVSPDYFKAMDGSLLRGRSFTEADEDGKPRVAMLDQSTARRYWPDSDPLGRRIRMGQGAWMTIIGIVKDMNQDGLEIGREPRVYVPMYQEFDVAPGYVFRDFSIVTRTSLPVAALEPEIRRIVQSVDSRLPVYDITSMNDLLDRSIASRRLSADLIGGFAGLALVLASIGIYGLLSYITGQRSREIGLRLALGASGADIVRQILGKGIRLASIGIAGGVLFSAAGASMISSLLYGVRPHDPVVFFLVPLLLLTVAALASYFPARRAAKVDPMIALRES